MANTPFYRIEIENLNLKTRLKMETQVLSSLGSVLCLAGATRARTDFYLFAAPLAILAL